MRFSPELHLIEVVVIFFCLFVCFTTTAVCTVSGDITVKAKQVNVIPPTPSSEKGNENEIKFVLILLWDPSGQDEGPRAPHSKL